MTDDSDGAPLDKDVVVVAVLLVLTAVVAQVAMQATAVQDDAFDSPVYPWTWLIFPLAAMVAAAARPSVHNVLVFTAALVVPMLIGTFLLGAVLYDGSGGASFWPAAEVINLFQGLVVALAALVGAGAGRLVRRGARRSAS